MKDLQTKANSFEAARKNDDTLPKPWILSLYEMAQSINGIELPERRRHKPRLSRPRSR